MTVESRLADLEAFDKKVDDWHIPAKLNKAGDAILALQDQISALKGQNHALTQRVAALEALLPNPPVLK